MGKANQLNLNNGTWGLEDERVKVGSTGGSLPTGTNGDIYLIPSDGYDEPSSDVIEYHASGPNRQGPSGSGTYYSANVWATVTTAPEQYSIVVKGDCWFEGQSGWGGSTATIRCSDTSILASTSITDGNSYPVGGGRYGWAEPGHGSGSRTVTVTRGTTDKTVTFYCSQSIAGYTTSTASVQVTIPAVDPDYNPPYHTNSNGWIWWTRQDGKTECWLDVTFSVGVSAWGSYYLSGSLISDAKRTYPVTFTSLPVVTFGMQNYNSSSGWNSWIAQDETKLGTTTQCPGLYAVRVGSATVGGHLYVHAIGDV